MLFWVSQQVMQAQSWASEQAMRVQPWGSPCLPCRCRGLGAHPCNPAVCMLQLRCSRAGFTRCRAELAGSSTTSGRWFGKPCGDLCLLTAFSFFQAMQ